MTQSTEYPDLKFVPPRAYGLGRDGRSVKYVVIHYTAGSERSTSAEDGAAYDQRRTDGTSTHYFHDPDSTVQCVLTSNRANACFRKGNRLGIQHELCGTEQTREQWLDDASRGVLLHAAKQVARDCKKYNLPVRKLSPAEVRACWYSNGAGGICGHGDVTLAYPEDGGTHTDPGKGFPWDFFLNLVQGFIDTGGEADVSIENDTYLWARGAVTGRDSAGNLLSDPWDGTPVVGLAHFIDEQRKVNENLAASVKALTDQVTELNAKLARIYA